MPAEGINRRASGRMEGHPSRKLVLLAPSGSPAVRYFQNVQVRPDLYHGLFAGMQRLRGAVYLEDGAIREQDLVDGRHFLDIDAGSWHLLVLDHDNRVSGCMRYREYSQEVSFEDLSVSGTPLAQSENWGPQLRTAVESEIALSRSLLLPFLEIGGWALQEQIRGTSEALRMALASYSLVRLLGGGVAISTATRRNGSASILKRLGGRSLKHAQSEMPAYYDGRYDCEMELLRFYSWDPNPRFESWIDELTQEIRSARVLIPDAPMVGKNYMYGHAATTPAIAPE